MRVAVNLLTENPHHPSGAFWFWTRVIPEMASRLEAGEELHLVVSPASKPFYEGYGPSVRHITFPWSNERRNLRTLSEHLYSPLRLPLRHIDVFNTPIAPIIRPAPGLVIHIKTMHAFTAPDSLQPMARTYRKLGYPRSVRTADAVIVNSHSLWAEVERSLPVDPAKLRLVPEAVDHDLFAPGDREDARNKVAAWGVTKPFALFVSSLWQYKNCDGLLRAWAVARPDLDGRQLAIVGHPSDGEYSRQLAALCVELGIRADVVFAGGVPLADTVAFYRAADVFVYPSFQETFGLPILEAMACGCPVVTADAAAMPETAGGAALLVDPNDPRSISAAIVRACGPEGAGLRELGLRRAREFSWAATGAATLDVYREAAARHPKRSSPVGRPA